MSGSDPGPFNMSKVSMSFCLSVCPSESTTPMSYFSSLLSTLSFIGLDTEEALLSLVYYWTALYWIAIIELTVSCIANYRLHPVNIDISQATHSSISAYKWVVPVDLCCQEEMMLQHLSGIIASYYLAIIGDLQI